MSEDGRRNEQDEACVALPNDQRLDFIRAVGKTSRIVCDSRVARPTRPNVSPYSVLLINHKSPIDRAVHKRQGHRYEPLRKNELISSFVDLTYRCELSARPARPQTSLCCATLRRRRLYLENWKFAL